MNLQEALNWIADVFEENPENIQPDTPRNKIVTWDSLGVLTLMAKMDEDFGIIISEDDLQNLKAVQDILDLLKKNKKLDEGN